MDKRLAIALAALSVLIAIVLITIAVDNKISKLDRKNLDSRPLPFSIMVGNDNLQRVLIINALSQEQKNFFNLVLSDYFHTQADNLAYYFKYFSIVEFTKNETVVGNFAFFSKELPELELTGNLKKLNWQGPKIIIDILGRQLVYSESSPWTENFNGNIKINVYDSGSLGNRGFILDTPYPPPQILKQPKILEQ